MGTVTNNDSVECTPNSSCFRLYIYAVYVLVTFHTSVFTCPATFICERTRRATYSGGGQGVHASVRFHLGTVGYRTGATV